MTDNELQAVRRAVAQRKAATEFPAESDPEDRYLAAAAHAEYEESRH